MPGTSPGMTERVRTWITGTSARSIASSPRPVNDDKRMLGENFVGWISESVIHRHNTVGYGFG